ncbi:hypothetical protein K490DRAFT_48928 [Saccharata proteae CBS 121410]|uniref:C2H2-type domain-containing protein n=1 Tax=Saccharata proteae CBS 121410 TaxID=1314787 RepID=A0A9P4HPY3_9PEZI|nr:hypothetical protein K490DRAFT_48928 [Saccharata proteae CBS 121410]
MPAIRGADSKKKTRRHTRDFDQIHADLRSKRHLEQYVETKVPEDLPGLGQFYCIECAKWFESDDNFTSHQKSKPHKRRVKQLKEAPHTQKEAEAAIGLTTDNGTRSKPKDVTGLSEAIDSIMVA